MKILAIDIGAGTEDVLLYDDRKKSVENCVKIVLPSPSQVFARRIEEAARLCKDVFVKGDVVGGGAFASALKEHLKKGFRVITTENAAYAVRNDLDEVRELGIEIVSGETQLSGFEGETLTVEEVNIEKLRKLLMEFGEPLLDVDVAAIAVQDHGVFPKGMHNRKFRVQKMKDILKESPRPETLAFNEDEIPLCFLRMKSAALASRRQLPQAKVLLMDTSTAAILGCLQDTVVEKADPVLVVNVGNEHTMAAIISNGNIVGMMEHHTSLLDPQKIERFLINFADRKLSDKEVFEDGGHGLFFLTEPPGFLDIDRVAATGPNRNILAKTKLSFHFAAPAGDVMMTGPIGLIEAAKRKFVT